MGVFTFGGAIRLDDALSRDPIRIIPVDSGQYMDRGANVQLGSLS